MAADKLTKRNQQTNNSQTVKAALNKKKCHVS